MCEKENPYKIYELYTFEVITRKIITYSKTVMEWKTVLDKYDISRMINNKAITVQGLYINKDKCVLDHLLYTFIIDSKEYNLY